MIIAIDTATPAVSVALAEGGEIVASFALLRARRHVETLMPVIEQLLEHAQVSYGEITCIAVDHGPGLFTGLRVGVATAKALALALRVPIVSASSLELLAHDFAQLHDDGDVLAVIDARRRELYAQTFSVRDGLVAGSGDPVCVSPVDADLLSGPGGASVRSVIGDAAVGSSVFAGRRIVPGYPRAERLALRAPDLRPADPDQLELLYLRAPDAEINWTSRP